MTAEAPAADATTVESPAQDAAASQPAQDQSASTAIATPIQQPFHELMPEKFRVFEGEGENAQFNLEQSAKKLLDSYSALERRGGAPESADDYTIDGKQIGDNFNFDEFKQDETNKAFLKSMHAAGLNNKQVEKVLEYGLKELMPGLMSGNQVLNEEQAMQHMQTEVWKDQGSYTKNMGFAHRAYSSLPESLQQKVNQRIGNDPVFLEVMALYGQEMREDSPPQDSSSIGDSIEVETLMMSEAYKNSKHPDHARVSQQVKSYFEKKFPQQS